MKPIIENHDMASVYNGYCLNGVPADMTLIQIFDICATRDFPEEFSRRVAPENRHSFEFLDVEDSNPEFDDFACTQEQADQIVKILKDALEADRRVLVHCFAGVSRSGAVVEMAVEMGFAECELYRAPNESILKKLKKAYNEC